MSSSRWPILSASVFALALALVVGHAAPGASTPPRWIVFSAHPGGATGPIQLMRVQTTGADLEQITTGSKPATEPAFSPDGRRIVFARLGSGIFRMNPDGTGLRRLTSGVRDIDFWTFSQPSDANGNYTSFFAASDKSQDDPVPLSVQVALGPVSYSSGFVATVKFKRLRSARMDVQLPASVGGVLPLPTSSSYEGAVYQGLLVGASAGGRVVKPLAAQWPDAQGRFRLVLPASARGQTVRLWQSSFQAFSTFPATPGGAVDLLTWPAGLSPRVSTGTASVRLP